MNLRVRRRFTVNLEKEKLHMAATQTPAGAKTRAEIHSQPACWNDCFTALDKSKEVDRICNDLSKEAEPLFIGCGSSYYISLAAAASWQSITGARARAVPASELLLFPDYALNDTVEYQPILVSRSGHSSEVVRAARYLEDERKIPTLAISCSKDHPLGETSRAMIHLLPADEESVVMTRSFSSMLLALQFLAACFVHQEKITEGLRRLPEALRPILDGLSARVEEFVQSGHFADYVFLGQGPLFGIASEGQLKLLEMSCSYAQVFHTLEFRHGPRAVVGPETLITFLLSESAYAAECEVLEEMKALGATTLVIANQADAAAGASADFLVELNLEVPECVRLVGYLLTCQLLGLYTGLKKGYDIDNPRHLSRAVILDSAAPATVVQDDPVEGAA
jgi:glucosamine--fructose-6-phosphate aminotransferase (isomerizing)